MAALWWLEWERRERAEAGDLAGAALIAMEEIALLHDKQADIGSGQGDLFDDDEGEDETPEARRKRALDALNQRFTHGTYQ